MILPFHEWKDQLLDKEAPLVRFRQDYYALYGAYCNKMRALEAQIGPLGLTYLVVDTETTGLPSEPGHKVCEIAGVWVKDGKIIKTFESKINPERDIPTIASSIHHLTAKHVANSPVFEEVWEQLLATHSFDVFVAHNAEFDFSFLPDMDKPILCTFKLAKKLWSCDHYSNQFLRYELGLDIPEVEDLPAHSALPDALVTAHILKAELDLLKDAGHFEEGKRLNNIHNLIAFSNKPNLLEVCAFGKHKGTRWELVPIGYLRWALDNMHDLDPDTLFTIKHYLGEK
jgi:DNA polymerase III epsilon subunit-like protein